MADELQIQREIVAEAMRHSAHAHKANNRYLVGVPDLYIQWPGLVGCWVEVKYSKDVRRDGFSVLHLTPKQRQYLIANQRAGGKSGWLMVVRVSARGDYLLQCGIDPNVKSVDMRSDTVMRRDRGGPWPIEEVVRRIAC